MGCVYKKDIWNSRMTITELLQQLKFYYVVKLGPASVASSFHAVTIDQKLLE